MFTFDQAYGKIWIWAISISAVLVRVMSHRANVENKGSVQVTQIRIENCKMGVSKVDDVSY
jgi:hypothetical protein